MLVVDLAAVCGDIGFSGPLVSDLHQVDCVEALALRQVRWCRGWKFPAIVSAAGVRRSFVSRPVKGKNHPGDLVQFDEIKDFGSHLHRAKEVRAARCECASTAGNVEAIESSET